MPDRTATGVEPVDFDDPGVRAGAARRIFRKDPICEHDEDAPHCWREYCPVRMEQVANRLAKEESLKGRRLVVTGWDIRNAVWTPPEERDERQQWLVREWDGNCPYEIGVALASEWRANRKEAARG